jgi:DUF4097 and DUF4098 domain-containing protein YvlB
MPRYRRVQTISHDIGPDGEVVLVVSAADVRLAALEGTVAELQATFEVTARDESDADARFEAAKLRVAASAGRLGATENGGNRGFGGKVELLFGGRDVDLARVEGSAPPGCRLEVRAVSGDLQTSGFRGQQRLHTVSGDHRIVEAGGALEVHSVSGDVSLRAVADIDVNVDTVSGDLSAEAPTIDRLDVNAVSGDVSVDGALGHGPHAIDTVSGDVRLATSSGVTVSVRGLASDIHSSLPHRIEGSADLRRLIVGDGAAPLAFSSMSGDLSVTHSRQAPSKPASTPPRPAAAPGPPTGDGRTAILVALERGEIDVDEAMRRLGGD